MAQKSEITQMLGLLIIVVIALALTPTIQTACVDAAYAPYTESDVVTPGTANTTTLDHPARNGSATYFTFTLNQTDSLGATTLTWLIGFNLTATSTITFYTLNHTAANEHYLVTMTYYWLSLGAAEQTLIALVPLFWVTLILASVVVVIIYKLKMH